MPVLQDFIADRIVLYRAVDPWLVREIIFYYDAEVAFRAGRRWVVHTLVDLSQAKAFPSDIIKAVTRSPSMYHPRAGFIVITGANSMFMVFIRAIIRVSGKDKIVFFDDLVSGMEFLAEKISAEGES